MCGIVGLSSREKLVSEEMCIVMRDTLLHRGPDSCGVWLSPDRFTALGHRRLSILDLSHQADQPMLDDSGRYSLVFNGEIYNFDEIRNDLIKAGCAFRTTSDTEVLLQSYIQWGADCLERLTGMFAFAICDLNRRQIFMARDRAGEKPLFYYQSNGLFAFASELKALMANDSIPRRLNPAALDSYLAFGYISGDKCILDGVRKLPAAHALTYDLVSGKLSLSRYWDVPADTSDALGVDAYALSDELEHLLRTSVSRQLVADVPVGVLLSGGVDSSLVTAIAAAQSTAPVRTFTISFPGHQRYDEAQHARLVADHFSTEHTELEADPATVDLLPELARQYDEPLADSSMVPTFLVSRLVRKHCTVALGGDGGDELFGGYGHYGWLYRQAYMRRIMPAQARRAVALCGNLLPVGTRGRNFLLAANGSLAEAAGKANLFFASKHRQAICPFLQTCQYDRMASETFKADCFDASHGMPGAAMIMDFRTYLTDDILVKVDRASMLNSLELRAPFLDHRIIDFAYSKVPNMLRINKGRKKILPKLLAKGLLPKTLDIERKQGFSLPLAAWFHGDWGSFMIETIQNAPKELICWRVVKKLIDAQRRGYVYNTERLFALTMLELWRKEYRVDLPDGRATE